MVLNITVDPNPILHIKSEPVVIEDLKKGKLKKLISDMIETMYARDGLGLAAPQVGASLQICTIAKDFTDKKKSDLVLINPKWEKASILKVWDEEGCLSVPKLYGQVKRFKKIKVTAFDHLGEQIQFIAENLFARVIQHEVDHLNGILFIEKAKDLHTFEKEAQL